MLRFLYIILALTFYLTLSIPNPNDHGLARSPIEVMYVDEDLEGLMCPIPMKDRVYNYTEIQCVYSSIEMLGRYAQEPKLYDLTSNPDCQGYSGPSLASQILRGLNVKFEQTTNYRDRSLIIKGVVRERRGVLFDIPGHAMVLVHYDEEAGIVKYVDNSDPDLKVRTWTMRRFNNEWDGWIMIIYADNDIIPNYYIRIAEKIPVINRDGSIRINKGLILFPTIN